MSSFPPKIENFIGEGDKRAGIYGFTNDPAKYLVERRRFERPTLAVVGGAEFEWPLGVEGIRIAGTAQLAEHLFIGDNAPVVQVMHLDNRRIELTGMFPGLTGSTNVQDLLTVITANAPAGKVLTLPGSMTFAAQIVQVESYDFSHPEDDRTNSWVYSITLRRVGVGKKVPKPKVIKSPNVPHSTTKPKGKPAKIFVVRAGVRTLRAVSKSVYKNADRWREIYKKNEKVLNSLHIPLHQLPTKPLPLGMRLHY